MTEPENPLYADLEDNSRIVTECTTMLEGLQISLEVFLGAPTEPVTIKDDLLKTIIDIANYRGALVIALAQLHKTLQLIPENQLSVTTMEAEQIRDTGAQQLAYANTALTAIQILANLQK